MRTILAPSDARSVEAQQDEVVATFIARTKRIAYTNIADASEVSGWVWAKLVLDDGQHRVIVSGLKKSDAARLLSEVLARRRMAVQRLLSLHADAIAAKGVLTAGDANLIFDATRVDLKPDLPGSDIPEIGKLHHIAADSASVLTSR